MRLANYLQYFTNFLSSKPEVQSLMYVDQRISWIYHPNLFPGILNATYNLPIMLGNYPSLNIHSAYQAVNKSPISGSRYFIMDGE
jgi:hypothetical protein